MPTKYVIYFFVTGDRIIMKLQLRRTLVRLILYSAFQNEKLGKKDLRNKNIHVILEIKESKQSQNYNKQSYQIYLHLNYIFGLELDSN